jgi:pimeloyl-ACP methyl ester carboxylesterase
MGASINTTGMPLIAGNRDFILIDKRGAGLSQPSLACKPEETAQECHQRLVRSGIDLSGYNTIENAADIADLRVALGYRLLNILGESYGSTLALQLMRDHPQGIRSVMMNGITGPTFNMFNDFIPNTWHGLQQVFRDCAATPACNAENPHLARTFIAVLARLQTHPAELHVYDSAHKRYLTGALTAVDLWWAANDYLANPTKVGDVPQLIARMGRGDFNGVAQSAESQQSAGQSQVSAGMNESMECSGEQATSSPAIIATRARSVPIPAAVRQALVASMVAGLEGCKAWRVPSIPAENHTYFPSTIPTLLMPGRYDPKTSPAQAYALARHLGHSHVVPFSTLSHEIIWSGCPAVIMSAFLAHPNRQPDTSCVSTMSMFWL